MRYQRGYINLGVLYYGGLVMGFAIGFTMATFMFVAVPKLWPYIKAWLHAVTG